MRHFWYLSNPTRHRHLLFCIIALGLLLTCSSVIADSRLYLSNVSGLNSSGNLKINQPVTFTINAAYDFSNGAVGAVSNGFRMYSPDGATWNIATGTWVASSDLFSSFTPNNSFIVYSPADDGMITDTIGFAGFLQNFNIHPLTGGFDEPVYTFSTQFGSEDVGKTFCIDSSMFYPSNDWGWGFVNESITTPQWGGNPYISRFTAEQGYCFTIGGNVSGVYLSHVDGLTPDGKIMSNVPITFTFSDEYGGYTDKLIAVVNGFRLSSPDGAVWSAPGAAWNTHSTLYSTFVGALVDATSFGQDGISPDTIGFAGLLFNQYQNGASAPLDESVYTITTQFRLAEVGKTFCIDSSRYYFANEWMWSNNPTVGDPVIFRPDWSFGPYAGNYVSGQGYCFTVAQGFVCGDINNDGNVTITDLTSLISFLFASGPSPDLPLQRGNMNCSSAQTPNLQDVTYLVRYLFVGGPAPCANCPL